MSKSTQRGHHDLNRHLVLLGLVALVLAYGAATQDRESVRAFIKEVGAPLTLVLLGGGALARQLRDKRKRRP